MNKPKTYFLSEKGRREYNQDACTVFSSGELTLLALADGMGGHNGGEIASKVVIETCKEVIRKAARNSPIPGKMRGILEELYLRGQEAIRKHIEENPSLTGMGTTLSCVLLLEDCYVWGNIGDSRVYHFNGSRLKQITVDHSYLEEYRQEHGDNIPEFVKARSNVITRSISGDHDQPDIFPLDKPCEKIKWDEGFLICSDGLILEKCENETDWMAAIISGNENLEKAAKQLVRKAYEMGSTDNISVILYEQMDFERQELEENGASNQDNSYKGEQVRDQHFQRLGIYRRGLWLIMVLLLVTALILGYCYGPWELVIKKKQEVEPVVLDSEEDFKVPE
ncbi:MAG: PP2C family protein-serine/threonine phosphatase [bacterium]